MFIYIENAFITRSLCGAGLGYGAAGSARRVRRCLNWRRWEKEIVSQGKGRLVYIGLADFVYLVSAAEGKVRGSCSRGEGGQSVWRPSLKEIISYPILRGSN
jgi:hypothetical protein